MGYLPQGRTGLGLTPPGRILARVNGVIKGVMKTASFVAACILGVVAAGCTSEQTSQAGDQVSKGAQSAFDKTKEVASNGWKVVEDKTAQVEETSKIKSAVGGTDVDTSMMSVETIGKTVYMIGHVPTQAMKDKADKIAKDIIDKGYTLEDDLKIGAADADQSAKDGGSKMGPQ
jgi:osmotically-inducible protein OsmY